MSLFNAVFDAECSAQFSAQAVIGRPGWQALVLVQNEAETPPCSSWQALCESYSQRKSSSSS